MPTESHPRPDQVTVARGSSLYDMTSLATLEAVQGTRMARPHMMWPYSRMVADSTPERYSEDRERFRKNGIQP